jgi:hypothetical protein
LTVSFPARVVFWMSLVAFAVKDLLDIKETNSVDAAARRTRVTDMVDYPTMMGPRQEVVRRRFCSSCSSAESATAACKGDTIKEICFRSFAHKNHQALQRLSSSSSLSVIVNLDRRSTGLRRVPEPDWLPAGSREAGVCSDETAHTNVLRSGGSFSNSTGFGTEVDQSVGCLLSGDALDV